MPYKRGAYLRPHGNWWRTWSKCAKLTGSRIGRGRRKWMEYGLFTVASTVPCLSDSRRGFSSDNGSPTDRLLGKARIFIPQVIREQATGDGVLGRFSNE